MKSILNNLKKKEGNIDVTVFFLQYLCIHSRVHAIKLIVTVSTIYIMNYSLKIVQILFLKYTLASCEWRYH